MDRTRDELLLARTPEQLRIADAKAAAIGGATAVSGDELRAAYPAFGPDVLGGQILGGAGTVEPEPATRAFAEAARSAGARIRTGVRVGSVRADGVLTDSGPVAADAVVVAAGPWIADLVRVPVKAGRGWLLKAERLDVPWIVEEVSWPDQVDARPRRRADADRRRRRRARRRAGRRVCAAVPPARR